MAREQQDTAVVGVARRRYWRAAEARVVVEAWRQSGQPLAAFARRYGLRAPRVGRWVRELEEGQEPVRFHPVRLVEREEPRQPCPDPIEIVLGDGQAVRVPAGFAAEDLTRVLSVLARGQGC